MMSSHKLFRSKKILAFDTAHYITQFSYGLAREKIYARHEMCVEAAEIYWDAILILNERAVMCMYIYCSLLQAHAIYYTHLWLIYRILSLFHFSRMSLCFLRCMKFYILFTLLLYRYVCIFLYTSTSPHRIIILNDSRQLCDTRLLTSEYYMTTRISLTHWATWDYYECLNIDIRLDHFTCPHTMHNVLI